MSKAAISCAGNPKILKQVVQTLIDFKLAADAERFLKRYPVALVQTEEYLLLDFQITDLICDAVTVLNKGRKLLQQGFVSEKFFEILVARAVEGKFVHAAEGIFQAAITRYPESRTKFEGIFRPLKSVSASQLGQTISPS